MSAKRRSGPKRPAGEDGGTDWLAVLAEQRATGDQMERDVPKTLSDPAITVEQAKKLFDALEKQVQFVEQLAKVLDGRGFDPDVVKACEDLEDLYAGLAAEAGEKVLALKG